MNLGIAGGRALVTGGSQGIGRAVVEAQLAEGCSVEFCGRTAQKVESFESKLIDAGHNVRGTALDLSDETATLNLSAESVARLGGIDILIANASAMLTADSDNAWHRNYCVEIASLRAILKNVTNPLVESAGCRGDSAIVVIGSTSASRSTKVDAYGATKAALTHYVKGLSRQLIQKGVRANMVSPGPVYSEPGFWANVKAEQPDYFENKVNEIPLGRTGRPEEIANIVCFLYSLRSRSIVGGNIVADGGRSDRPHY